MRRACTIIALAALALAPAGCKDSSNAAGDAHGSVADTAEDGTAAPGTDSAEPAKDTAEPSADLTEPAEDAPGPASDSAEPPKDTEQQAKDTGNAEASGSDTSQGDVEPGDVAEEVVQETAFCAKGADAGLLAGEGLDTAEAAVKTCAASCGTDAGMAACVSACLFDATGLSEDCSSCFAERLACTALNCSEECAEDPAATECGRCESKNHCHVTFYACSGLPCLAPFEYCGSAADCCDGQLCDIVGGLVAPVCCGDIGHRCVEDNDCCGNTYCVLDGAEVGTCQDCATTGFECEEDDDCCFGPCWNGSCQPGQ